jgi:hypothetical protein
MISKTFAAIAALSMVAASGPAAAQSLAPPTAVQVGEPVADASALEGKGPAFYVISAIVLGLIIWGIIELIDDEEDSISP